MDTKILNKNYPRSRRSVSLRTVCNSVELKLTTFSRWLRCGLQILASGGCTIPSRSFPIFINYARQIQK